MRYLIDTNKISSEVLRRSQQSRDIFVLDEIVREYSFEKRDKVGLLRASVQILEIKKKHLQKLMDVLKEHGDNLDLIRLFSNNGSGDVLMLAYVLSEMNNPDTLFEEKYTIVTADTELTRIAKSYSINCITEI